MTPDRWNEIERLFNRAHEMPAEERAAWLDTHAEDPAIRAEVESLLANSTGDERIPGVERAIGGAAMRAVRVADATTAGRQVGPFRLVRLLGQGGMGSVFLAERDDSEFQQQVAIKILRHGMDSPEAVERFRQERKILAGLEHPHIARLLDGGTTADGLPYIAMEYIDGKPLPAWVEERKAPVSERLRLFREICEAVQYAHRNLVVHRDLKASNILVTAGGTAKLLDFGIAKLLDGGADPTVTSARAFTPNYASPEQVKGGAVTTSSDVYSLGVVLFELLTGRLPYRLPAGASGYALERAICEEEAPGPGLGNDLDAIVRKAMRKEPGTRYSSVEAFSADIGNYLEGRPVTARRGTLAYRTVRFLARHRWMIAAAAVAAVIAGAGVVSTVHQRRRAERRFAQVRSLANTFLFQVHDGLAELPGSTRLREQLVKTALVYLDSLAPEALGDVALQMELANAYYRVGNIQYSASSGNLGQAREAIVSWEKAVGILRQLGGQGEAARLEGSARLEIGVARQILGEFAEAEREFRRGLEIGERLRGGLEGWDAVSMVVSARNRLGDLEMRRGHPERALAEYRPALAAMEAAMAERPEARMYGAMATGHLRMGDALHATGDPAGALTEYDRATEVIRGQIAAGNRREGMLRLEGIAAVNRGNVLGGVAPHLGKREGAGAAYRDAIRVAARMRSGDRQNARLALDLAAAYAGAIPLADSKDAAVYGRELLQLTGELLSRSPESIEFGKWRPLALWGLGRRKEALTANAELRRRAPEDAELRRQLMRMRLAMGECAAVAEEAAGVGNGDAFARALAEQARECAGGSKRR